MIVENHLEKMGGILLGSKQEVISVKKIFKIIIWQCVWQSKQPLIIFLDAQLVVLLSCTMFTFRNSKDISGMRNWRKIGKKRVVLYQHNVKIIINSTLSNATNRQWQSYNIINTTKNLHKGQVYVSILYLCPSQR